MTVKLKNFGSISPAVYLRLFLGFLFAFGLFLLLFFPGIRHEGTWLEVKSQPSGAIVTVNGTFAGTAPTKIFLPARSLYSVEIEKPGFPTQKKEINAKGRLFATLFFPVREKIDIVWEKPQSPEICYERVLAEFCDFALADREYSPSVRKQSARSIEPNYFFTETLDFFVRNFKGFLNDEEIETAVLRAAALCTHEVTAQALLNAYCSLYPSLNAVEAADAVLTALNDFQPRSAALFRRALPRPIAETLTVAVAELQKIDYRSPKVRPDGNFSALGERWFHFPRTDQTVAGKNGLPPASIAFGNFWIQQREVTAALYRRFLNDCPQFAPENSAALEREGLADAFYMRRFPEEAQLPAVSVSWHAAQAFCRWLEQQPELRGFKARLPYSAEIEILTADDDLSLANLNGNGVYRQGSPQADALCDLIGNVWEWCQNPPLRDSATEDDFLLNLPSEIKAVAGGSYQSQSFTATECGAQFAVWSSPFTGFRVVLEKE